VEEVFSKRIDDNSIGGRRLFRRRSGDEEERAGHI